MAEIGVERLGAGDDQEYGAERHQPDLPVAIEKRHRIGRIDGREHARIVADVQKSSRSNRDEPDHHDRRKEARHPRRSPALGGEQAEQDGDGERHHIVVESGRNQLQAFDRRQYRDRRRDHRVSQEHGGADDPEQKDQRRAPPECARRERGQGQRAALPVVVGAQQNQHVLERDHDDQRPQDKRQHAENDVARDRAGLDRRHDRLAKRVERARADVAIDDPHAAEGQRPQTWPVRRSDLGGRMSDAGRGIFFGYIGHGGRVGPDAPQMGRALYHRPPASNIPRGYKDRGT